MSGVVKHVKHVISHPFESITDPVKSLKGEWNTAKNFTKHNWKKILIAAAIVFTCGIATVGVAGFASAMAAGGGGFAGFMSATGATFAAGAGTLTGGLIGGSSAAAGGGAAAAAGGATTTGGSILTGGTYVGAGSTAATDAYLGAAASTGSLAGTAGSAYAGLGSAVGAGGTAAGGGLLASGAEGAGNAAASTAGNGVLSGGSYASDAAANNAYLANAGASDSLAAPTAYSDVGTSAASGASGASGASAGVPADYAYTPFDKAEMAAVNSGAGGAGGSASDGLMSDMMHNQMVQSALVKGGIGLLKGAAQGQAMQDALDQSKPLSYWGVGARGDSHGGGAVDSPFATGEALNRMPGVSVANNGQLVTPQQAQRSKTLQAMYDPRTNLPNGAQGLMTMGWNVNRGQPFDPHNPMRNMNFYGA